MIRWKRFFILLIKHWLQFGGHFMDEHDHFSPTWPPCCSWASEDSPRPPRGQCWLYGVMIPPICEMINRIQRCPTLSDTSQKCAHNANCLIKAKGALICMQSLIISYRKRPWWWSEEHTRIPRRSHVESHVNGPHWGPRASAHYAAPPSGPVLHF